MQLGKEGALKLGSVRHFVLDECDKMLDKTGAHSPCPDSEGSSSAPVHYCGAIVASALAFSVTTSP